MLKYETPPGLQHEAASVLRAERDQAIAVVIEQMALSGISLGDLKVKSNQHKKAKSHIDAKFKDPATSKTWSGHGR
jgi:DNA-binding protein H-NS